MELFLAALVVACILMGLAVKRCTNRFIDNGAELNRMLYTGGYDTVMELHEKGKSIATIERVIIQSRKPLHGRTSFDNGADKAIDKLRSMERISKMVEVPRGTVS